jgi:hypothetical protein
MPSKINNVLKIKIYKCNIQARIINNLIYINQTKCSKLLKCKKIINIKMKINNKILTNKKICMSHRSSLKWIKNYNDNLI